MANVRIENTREHPIKLTGIDLQNTLVQIEVPAAKPAGQDPSGKLPGAAEVADEFIRTLRKQSAVVDAYFTLGWLRMQTKQELPSKPGKAASV